MPTAGCIEPVNVNQPSSWDAYAERLKFFFEANGITDKAKKRATLLAVCGLPTLTIAKSLISPKSLSDVPYEDIVVALKSHFIPKPSVIYQRFNFQRRLQRDGEGVASYIAELRHLADDCNFGSNLNERLRDQLSWTLTVLYAKRSLPSQLPVKLKISVQQTGRTLKPLPLSRFAKAEIGAAEITLGPSAASGRPFADDALARAISKGSADREMQGILHSVLRARVVPLVGACTVDVTYGRNKGRLRLYVAKGRRTNLLGSDWFETLGIRLVGVHHIDSDPVARVLEEFSDVFSHDDFGAYSGPPVHLQLDPSVKPIQLKARRIPIALAPKIDAEIDRLIQHGILEPTENTKWATPVVPVVKQNGEVRLCADYKCTINKALRQHPYPIPQVDRLLRSQAGGATYAKVDLANAYLQIRVDDESADAQTIVTHRGAFRVKRLQFGVCTAPGIFQSCVENLLRDIPGVTPYFDDILVKAGSDATLADRLRCVFDRFRSAGLRIRKDKCLFGVRSVDFLGYRLDASGIHPTKAKTDAIHKAPTPNDKKELQAFLGLLNFYHNFLKAKATVAEPLHQLLRANTKWVWTSVHEEAFNKVKQLLSHESFLVGFDESLPIILTCDASQYGIGAVLAHDTGRGAEAPIAFYSRTITSTERNYAQIDREALAIVSSVRKFHDYLYGRRFTIVTDHKPLLGLFAPSKATPQILSPRLLRWSQLLRAYDFELIYRPGNAISHADGLSRLPAPSMDIRIPPLPEVRFLEELPRPPLHASDIAAMSVRDPIISRVLNWAWRGWPSVPLEDHFQPFVRRQYELSCHLGCLLCGNRVVIPEAGSNVVLDELHGGHPGIVRMKGLARAYVWWPGIDKQIEDRVKQCQACQESRHDPPKAPTHPWEVTRAPWSRVHLHFAGPFQGHLFLIVVDSHSKWLEVAPVPAQSSKALIAELRRIFATHGLPDTVVSDNGTAFTSSEFSDFLKRNAIRHAKVSPYHPSSNGQAERMVQTAKDHTTPCVTTGRSPAELLMNRRLKTRLDRLHPDLTCDRQRMIDDVNSSNEPRKLKADQPVLVKNFSSGPRWTPAVIMEPSCPVSYRAVTTDGRTVHRHIDHILGNGTVGSDAAQGERTESSPMGPETERTDEACGPSCPSCTAPPATSRPVRNRRPPQRLRDYVI
uniref:RNA-directed DNA polymerase n=1 Tax=Trichuris muris TaxID=70415 RepID=A0A5S6QH47_TRIMR